MMLSTNAVSHAAQDSLDSGHSVESVAKRRKTRKGTRSCWECKRRKMRCSFSTSSDSVCITCRRRGTSCISQEYPEETATAASSAGDRGRHIGDRMVRVEAMIEQLVRQSGNGRNSSTISASSSTPKENGSPHPGIPTPGSSDGAESTRFLNVNETSEPDLELESRRPEESCSTPGTGAESLTTTTPSGGPLYEKISTALHAALPPREDIHLMIKAGIDVSIHRIMTHPLAVLAQTPEGGRANLANIPEANTHPVLLAKYLLILATCLQYAHPEFHADAICGLSEPPRQLMHRLSETAMSLVTNNDEFLGSIEGLECVMLEVIYQANGGNLRRAWFACRRAMVIAQMMGIHRSSIQHPLKVIDPSEPIYPSFIWYRIICTDRQLSLMLGLPQGSQDVSMASEVALASDTPSGRLERKQTAIASRILERNESSDPAIRDDFTGLQELDTELQKAANEMPSKWWLVPNLTSVGHDPEKTFWGLLRLLNQVFYFNLLNLLHLPYMLRSSTHGLERGGESVVNSKFEYSMLASVNASRELLARFIMFRSFNRVAFCCRSVDFFALTASMTLIIAHLDGHRKQRQHGTGVAAINVLGHQRNGDRAMMEQVLENMEGVTRLNTDVLSERSSSLLKSLLILEADAAAAPIIEPQSDSASDNRQFLRIDIPYFGTIRIGREGVISMEEAQHATQSPPKQQRHVPSRAGTSAPPIRTSEGSYTVGQVSDCSGADILPMVHPPFDDLTSEMAPITQRSQQVTQISSPATQLSGLQEHQLSAPHFPTTINDALQQQYLYPGLTAGADDWAFQGVDMAFFDSLFRGAGVESAGNDSNGANWQGIS